MMERGMRGAATVRAFGCGLVVVVLLLTVVAEGQARVGHPPGRASLGKGALAPVTFTYTDSEQTYTVPAGVESLQVQAVGADGGDRASESRTVLGGRGGMVTGDLAVAAGTAITPGDTLYVAVGGTATRRAAANSTSAVRVEGTLAAAVARPSCAPVLARRRLV